MVLVGVLYVNCFVFIQSVVVFVVLVVVGISIGDKFLAIVLWIVASYYYCVFLCISLFASGRGLAMFGTTDWLAGWLVMIVDGRMKKLARLDILTYFQQSTQHSAKQQQQQLHSIHNQPIQEYFYLSSHLKVMPVWVWVSTGYPTKNDGTRWHIAPYVYEYNSVVILTNKRNKIFICVNTSSYQQQEQIAKAPCTHTHTHTATCLYTLWVCFVVDWVHQSDINNNNSNNNMLYNSVRQIAAHLRMVDW